MSIVIQYPCGYTNLHLEGRCLSLLVSRRKVCFVAVDSPRCLGWKQMRSLAMWSRFSWTLHAQCDGRARGAVEISDKSALETSRRGQAASHWNWCGSCDAED